jgi:lysophospholipase L1-like esterase
MPLLVKPAKRVIDTFTAALLLASILMLNGCGSDPELRMLPEEAIVLAFGDSLTAGLGVTVDQAYPAVLQELIGRTVINAGVSGELTQDGLLRLPGLLTKHSPDLVILLEGGNDILQSKSLEVAKANLSRMITLVKAHGADLVLVGVPKRSLLAGTAGLYEELAKQHQVPLEKDIVGSLLKQPSMKSDAVHFNAAGYNALAKSIHQLLRLSGAL